LASPSDKAGHRIARKIYNTSLHRLDICYLSIVQIVPPAAQGAPTEGVFVMTPSPSRSTPIETLIDRATPIFFLSLTIAVAVSSLLLTAA
jgi:hypothetical protein